MKYNIFTTEEIEKLSKADGKIADSAIIMLRTGLRLDELLNVKRSDIDLNERIIYVAGGKVGDRVLPIPDSLLPIIERNIGNEYLIDIDKRLYKREFAELMEKLGFEHTPYELRHTFLSLQKCH